MFEYGPCFIVIKPNSTGDFDIEVSNKEPESRPGMQYLHSIQRKYLYPIKVYGVNVHLGEIDFEQMNFTYWRLYQMISSRMEWA